jgi:hypothetical protein
VIEIQVGDVLLGAGSSNRLRRSDNGGDSHYTGNAAVTSGLGILQRFHRVACVRRFEERQDLNAFGGDNEPRISRHVTIDRRPYESA